LLAAADIDQTTYQGNAKLTDLLSVAEAQARILAFFQPVDTEITPLLQCAGRVLAETVYAPGDLPPFDNSSMDGFAVKAQDVQQATAENPVVLRVVADIPAGIVADIILEAGQAARIMTGAPLPQGADAIVPVESTDFAPALSSARPTSAFPIEVKIYKSVRRGESVRPRGQDIHKDQVLLEKGRKLKPQDVGILASIGQQSVRVFRKPRIALFSSGDELVQPGKPLGPGQIYDSNQFVLAAMLEAAGAEVLRLGTSPDDPVMIETLLNQAIARQADLIVTSAGVSVGAFDFVRQVIETRGRLEFWRVNMRPGKPLAFGLFDQIPLVGLPGNPVSAYVGCRVFVMPVLRKLAGQTEIFPNMEKATLGESVESDGRESYLRAIVEDRDGKPVATLTGHQGSGNLYSLVQANALLIVPSGVKSLPSGSEVNIWFLEEK
jgi:molybdopterin molybdotransferase